MTKPIAYQTIRGGVDAIDNVVMFVGCAMLFALMFIVVADVSLRYLFNAPIQWAYEVVSSYLMPGLFFFAVSHTLKAHAHVSVDIVHNYISPRARYVFEAVATLVSIPAFAICTWVSARNTMADLATAAESTSGLAVPTWTISIMLPIGFGLLTIRLILNAIGYLGTLASGRELLALPPIAGTEETAQ
ncbi:TRAP transporter small permease subunit [Polaromonas sp. AER18D-145]|uniref:TRAP transporter small permease subunit n=1 Tax=Polaromonas sp. AER18D-145 TaxID=1977060 RepID=UPI000BBC25CE|nr:TRAP transporter small permease [Polaromonas sp. AER18D-145]